jgi:hypothetical protein
MIECSVRCRIAAGGIVMSLRRLKLPWLACLSLLFLAMNGVRAQSQNLVSARILSIDGPVEIRRAPQSGAKLKKVSFKLHDDLRVGDRIVTRWQGRLVLGLSDGSLAIIAEHTVIEIKELNSSPRELFNVVRGKTRVYIDKLGGRPNPYRINTPTAVIAVRGTLFDVIVRTNDTEVFVHEGQVAVSNVLGPEAIVLLSAGQMTRVRREQAPSTPAPFRPGRNDDSFRRMPVTRPLDGIADSLDTNLEDRRLVNTRPATPMVRDTSTSSAPVGGQRSPGRRP